MQSLAQGDKNVFVKTASYPLPPENGTLLVEDLGTLVKSLPRIPPWTGTSHGGDWSLETNRCIHHGYRLVLFIYYFYFFLEIGVFTLTTYSHWYEALSVGSDILHVLPDIDPLSHVCLDINARTSSLQTIKAITQVSCITWKCWSFPVYPEYTSRSHIQRVHCRMLSFPRRREMDGSMVVAIKCISTVLVAVMAVEWTRVSRTNNKNEDA